ncbi:hypothetical protein TRVL_07384 [Trypanosoma vivax]|nr:hypothetical protein TRVL_07384 [Trypanosoma vivax]
MANTWCHSVVGWAAQWCGVGTSPRTNDARRRRECKLSPVPTCPQGEISVSQPPRKAMQRAHVPAGSLPHQLTVTHHGTSPVQQEQTSPSARGWLSTDALHLTERQIGVVPNNHAQLPYAAQWRLHKIRRCSTQSTGERGRV